MDRKKCPPLEKIFCGPVEGISKDFRNSRTKKMTPHPTPFYVSTHVYSFLSGACVEGSPIKILPKN